MNRSAKVSLFNLLFRCPFRQYYSIRSSSASLASSSSTILFTTSSSDPVMPASHFHSFSIVTSTHVMIRHNNQRNYSNNWGYAQSDPESYQSREVEGIDRKTKEAREALEKALNPKERMDKESVRDFVNETVGAFEVLLSRLPQRERVALQRSMCLQIAQLKALLQRLDE